MRGLFFLIFHLTVWNSIYAQQGEKIPKYCLIDRKGVCVRTLDYDRVDYLGRRYCRVGKISNYVVKYGITDRNLNLLVQPEYDKIESIGPSMFAITKDKKVGIIDSSMRVLVPPTYDYISYFVDGFAKVELNRKTGVIRKDGILVVPLVYGDLLVDHGRFLVLLNGLHGYLDSMGNTLLPLQYAELNQSRYGLISGKDDSGYKIFDRNGRLVLHVNPEKYKGAYVISAGTVVGELRGSDKRCLLDLEGNRITDKDYDFLGDYRYGMFAVGNNDKYGYINEKGREVIPLVYDIATDFGSGYTGVCKDKKCGIIDSTGKIIIPLIYDAARYYNKMPVLQLKLGNKYAFADLKGKLLTPFKYDHMMFTDSARFDMTADGKEGYFDTRGWELIPTIYERCYPIGDTIYAAKKDGLWGIFNYKHENIIPCRYKELLTVDNGLLLVREN